MNLKEFKTVNHVVFRVEQYPVVQTLLFFLGRGGHVSVSDSYCLHLDTLCGDV